MRACLGLASRLYIQCSSLSRSAQVLAHPWGTEFRCVSVVVPLCSVLLLGEEMGVSLLQKGSKVCATKGSFTGKGLGELGVDVRALFLV